MNDERVANFYDCWPDVVCVGRYGKKEQLIVESKRTCSVASSFVPHPAPRLLADTTMTEQCKRSIFSVVTHAMRSLSIRDIAGTSRTNGALLKCSAAPW